MIANFNKTENIDAVEIETTNQPRRDEKPHEGPDASPTTFITTKATEDKDPNKNPKKASTVAFLA